MSIAVFLGPSLPRAEAESILGADYHPPIRQGDIYRLIRRARPQAIAVVDGYFQEVPSVWHKEILWALDQGIPVYGAASMGALRAAELHRHGMVGLGKIFESYRRGAYAPYDKEVFEDDDEVAVIHGPAELSYPALSDAMVDIRETLAGAARAGIVDEALRDALVATFKRRFYRDRNLGALPEVLQELGVAESVAEPLLAWLPKGRVSQKRADAQALLGTLAGAGPALPSQREAFVFERTSLWAQFVEQTDEPGETTTEAESLVLEELRLDPQLYDTVSRTAMLWSRLEAGSLQPPLDDEGRRATLDPLRRRHGLMSRAALDAWAEDCDLDRSALDRLLRYEAAMQESEAVSETALDLALLDVLRGEGHYLRLAERARDKQERLTQQLESGAAPSALSSESLLDWYFEERLGRSVPMDVRHYAEMLGYGGLEGLLAAIRREHGYLTLGGTAGVRGQS